MAFSGFSDLEMSINMPASLMLVLWVMVVGASLWRKADMIETIAQCDLGHVRGRAPQAASAVS
jgi:hypothetical protein